MMNEFWSFKQVNKNNIALINEKNESITYQQLDDAIEAFIAKLPKYRILIFLKVQNSYNSVVAYLACLRSKNPFLLIDTKIDNSLLTELIDCYSPNYLVSELNLKLLNKEKIVFHPDLAMLLSTSGTTGTPKLVRLSRKNILANTHSIIQYLGIKENDCTITTLPMSYSYGLSIINTHLGAGGCIVINNHNFIEPLFWEKVNRHHVVTFAGVPFSFQLLKKLDYSRFENTSLRYLTQAGGKLDNEILRYFQDQCAALGQKFIVMYGQTEASPRMSYVPANRLVNKIGSIGIAVPNGCLCLHDGQGMQITRPYVEGEIVYKGANVMLGYATNVVDLQRGDELNNLLKTGDLGHFDEDGFFYVTGRIRRFIKLFGLRISLDAIDNWFIKNQINAVCVGQDDLLVICYQLSASLSANKIRQKVAHAFKINIRSIKVVNLESVPRINGGKVDYKTLTSRVLDTSH